MDGTGNGYGMVEEHGQGLPGGAGGMRSARPPCFYGTWMRAWLHVQSPEASIWYMNGDEMECMQMPFMGENLVFVFWSMPSPVACGFGSLPSPMHSTGILLICCRYSCHEK